MIGFPKGYSFAFGTLAVNANKLFAENEKIELHKFHVPAGIRNVIFVIDESISFDEISRGRIDNKKIFNFGRTISGGNCSATSNYILRKGVSEISADGRCTLVEVKSLFQIAKENGWQTYYVDAQGVLRDRTVRDYFTDFEISFIDNYIDVSGKPLGSRDIKIPSIIRRCIVNLGKNFILINKAGVHFPYEMYLDKNDAIGDNIDNYRKILNKNVINVLNEFAIAVDDETVIFYTSDHGQNFDGGATHCNIGSDIRKEEYFVPFYLITDNEYIKNTVQNCKKNTTNHYIISESVRNLLGVEVADQNSIFKSDIPYINCGVYGQPIKFFGNNVSCLRID